ncbi:MAG: TPM domain-containing protein [Dongiaceae bacterium]
MIRLHLILLLLVGALAGTPALGAVPDYPALTGRVVDNAGLLSRTGRAALEAKLADFERARSTQVVVATVPTLQGYAIEEYANGLFRAWGIGQRGTNNGALLLVAPKEREVKIEVGYGLEGTLTDALSSAIIQQRILPQFRAGGYEAGIFAGVDGILAVLDPTYKPSERVITQQVPASEGDQGSFLPFVIVAIWVIALLFLSRYRRHRGYGGFGGGFGGGWGRGGGWSSGGGGSSGGGSSGGGFSGGGFSGGGGSSGGGGATGRW